MKFYIIFFLFTFFGLAFYNDYLVVFAFSLTLSIALYIILYSNDSFVFREWALLLYAVNYLLSPAVTYQVDLDKIAYAMKISSDDYFLLAIPGFLFFALGMFTLPTRIFRPNFSEISKSAVINERFLYQMTLIGVLFRLCSDFFTSEFAFFFYLVSLVRFIGVFALFGSNPRKHRYLALLVIGFEMYNGFRAAMFHDAVMWIIFFALYYIYISKPSLSVKIIGASTLIIFVLLIQSFKSEYRDLVWRGGATADIETISEVGLAKANYANLTGENNLLETLNRGNQAWIFASTVDNMDRNNDFQGMNNVVLYMESALLPRFLAPNKIMSGDRWLFNRFSGHEIRSGTSMGLGVFSDGYIAYGKWGVFMFSFVLGLLFSFTFKLVEGWSKISPFYVLLILPILNYAVRPDCELQTTINHLVKSILVFGGLVYLTKFRFTIESNNLNKK